MKNSTVKELNKLLILCIIICSISPYFASFSKVNHKDKNITHPITNKLPEDANIINCTLLGSIDNIINLNPVDFCYKTIDNKEILFLSCSSDGLYLFDVKDKSNPFLITSYDIDFFSGDIEYIYSVIFKENLCFIANRKGVVIYDFSDIYAPNEVNDIYLDRFYYKNIKLANSLLYLLDFHKGCLIYDITSVDNPTFVNQIEFRSENYYDIVFYNSNGITKIILSTSNFILEYNFTSILDPRVKILSEHEIHYASNLKIKDSYLFTTTNYNNLMVFNLSNDFELVSKHHDNYQKINCFTIKEERMFIGGLNRFICSDISNIQNFTLVKDISTNCFIYKMITNDNYLYCLDNSIGLLIYSIKNIESIDLESRYFLINSPRDIIVSGKYAYLSTKYSGIFIINIKKPMNPKLITHLVCFYEYVDLKIENKRLYVFARDYYYSYKKNIIVYDISNPKSPKKLQIFNEEFTSTDYTYIISYHSAQIIDNRMFVISSILNMSSYLYVLLEIDLTDLSNITIENVLIEDSHINRFYIKNGYLLMVTHSGENLTICKLSTKEVVFQNYFSNDINEVLIEENFLYLSMDEEGLVIFDISDISSPVELSSIDYKLEDDYYSYHEIFVSNNYLYLFDASTDNVYIFNVRNKANPIFKGEFGDINQIYDIYVEHNHVFVTNSEIPLLIFHLNEIPLTYGISNQIIISIGVISILVIGVIAFSFYRRRRFKAHLDVNEVLISTKDTTDDDSIILRKNNVEAMNQKIELPETNDPELQKYLQEIFNNNE